jgi:hypothetical protein
MVALAPRDDAVALRLPGLDEAVSLASEPPETK